MFLAVCKEREWTVKYFILVVIFVMLFSFPPEDVNACYVYGMDLDGVSHAFEVDCDLELPVVEMWQRQSWNKLPCFWCNSLGYNL